MAQLAIDIGNTAVKCAVFDGSAMLVAHTAADLSETAMSAFLRPYSRMQSAIISSVRSEEETQKYCAMAQQWADSVLLFNADTPIPVVNLYETPHTLGCDRLAAAVGANMLFPRRNTLAVCAGTALTFELVTEDGEYVGGNISLGMHSRYAALHRCANRLPLCSPSAQPPALGRNTNDAIAAGVQHGMLYEIRGTAVCLEMQYPLLQIVLTGGDAALFAPHIAGAALIPNLVLTGLNRILNYQREI